MSRSVSSFETIAPGAGSPRRPVRSLAILSHPTILNNQRVSDEIPGAPPNSINDTIDLTEEGFVVNDVFLAEDDVFPQRNPSPQSVIVRRPSDSISSIDNAPTSPDTSLDTEVQVIRVVQSDDIRTSARVSVVDLTVSPMQIIRTSARVSDVDLTDSPMQIREKSGSTLAQDSNANLKCGPTCPVCLLNFADIKNKGLDLMSTMCGHVYCMPCLTRIIGGKLSYSCPVCRSKQTRNGFHKIYID